MTILSGDDTSQQLPAEREREEAAAKEVEFKRKNLIYDATFCV